jgi:hypothetical protein
LRLPGLGKAGTCVTGSGIDAFSAASLSDVDFICPSEIVGGFVAPQATIEVATALAMKAFEIRFLIFFIIIVQVANQND